MAEQKLSKGFHKIPNQLVDAFCRLKLSGNEWRIIWVIIRQTYGWRKETELISLSTFAEKTGIPERHVSSVLRSLLKKNVIRKDTGTYITGYGLQEDFSLWGAPPNPGKPEMQAEVPQESGGKVPQESGDIKDSIKDTIIKPTGIGDKYFEKFFSEYPLAIKRNEAEKEWKRLNPDPVFAKKIISSILDQKVARAEAEKKKRFWPPFPSPARWLKEERWTDHVDVYRAKEYWEGLKDDGKPPENPARVNPPVAG